VRSDSHLISIEKKISKNVFYSEINTPSRISTYRLLLEDGQRDVEKIFESHSDEVCNILELCVSKYMCCKFMMTISGIFCKESAHEEEITDSIKNFSTSFIMITSADYVSEKYELSCCTLMDTISEFQTTSSGWSVLFFCEIKIQVVEIKAKSVGTYMPTPVFLRKLRNTLINVKSDSERCLLYTIAAYFHHDKYKDPENPENYEKYLKKFNLGSLEFPLSLREIDKFITLNKEYKLSISIFELDDKKNLLPLKVVENENRNHIDILLLTNQNNGQQHTVLIVNFEKFYRKFINKNYNKIHVCKKCLTTFTKFDNYSQHKEIGCNQTKISFPRDDFVQFKKHYTKMGLKFTCYVDLESILVPIQGCENNPLNSYSQNVKRHNVFAAGLLWHSKVDEPHLDEIRLFTDENPVESLILQLEDDSKYIVQKYYAKKHAISSLPVETKKVLREKFPICHLCNSSLEELPHHFNAKDPSIHLDHDHALDPQVKRHIEHKNKQYFIGNVTQFVHKICNLFNRIKIVIPIYIHSSITYDSHFILQALTNLKRHVSVIAKTSESYLLLSWQLKFQGTNITFRIIDSLSFLQASLKNLIPTIERYPKLESFIAKQWPSAKITINKAFHKKQFLPYDFFSSNETLMQTEFPTREQFFNSLTSENVSEVDYEFALDIFKQLNCSSLLDYVKFYLITDVYYLEQLMIEFRDVCFKEYAIDVGYYFTLASYAYDLALMQTKEKIYYMKDVNQINFTLKAIRGGYCDAISLHEKANFPELKTYDDKKPLKTLCIQDFNSLYMFCLTKAMPTGPYYFLNKDEIKKLEQNIFTYVDDLETQSILVECDLTYPRHLWDQHKDLPFLPEKCQMRQSSICKLIAHFYPRRRYVLILESLQLAVKHGLRLERIRMALMYHKSFWLKSFVEKNSRLRNQPNIGTFYSNIFKLLSNAGKMNK
jgi:hypothetical protein